MNKIKFLRFLHIQTVVYDPDDRHPIVERPEQVMRAINPNHIVYMEALDHPICPTLIYMSTGVIFAIDREAVDIITLWMKQDD